MPRTFFRLTILSLVTIWAACIAPTAAFGKGAIISAVAVQVTENWSFDDIKDVCEATQFVMICLVIGSALYWFFCLYMPDRKSPRLELDVAMERSGETDAVWLVEVVALLHNRGSAPMQVSDLHCVVHSVSTESLLANGGPLTKANGLKALCDTHWEPALIVLDGRTQRRCSLALVIPKTVAGVVISASANCEKRPEPYLSSKLVWLAVKSD